MKATGSRSKYTTHHDAMAQLSRQTPSLKTTPHTQAGLNIATSIQDRQQYISTTKNNIIEENP